MRTYVMMMAMAVLAACGGCEDESGETSQDMAQGEDVSVGDMAFDPIDMGSSVDMSQGADAANTPDLGASDDLGTSMSDMATADMGQPGPLCYFPANGLHFPPAAVGVPASTSAFSFGTVSVWNCSDADVVVTGVAMSAATAPEIAIDFVPFNGASTTIEPNETMNVELRFAPEAEGDYVGALEITHQDGQVDSVDLTGKGITDPGHCRLAIGPTLADPGDLSRALMRTQSVEVDGSFNDNFVLANVGRTECNVQSITLDSPTGAFSFPFPNQVQTPTTLSFRQLRVINIGFDPTTVGTHTATLTMTSDDGTTPTHVLEVSGEAF